MCIELQQHFFFYYQNHIFNKFSNTLVDFVYKIVSSILSSHSLAIMVNLQLTLMTNFITYLSSNTDRALIKVFQVKSCTILHKYYYNTQDREQK